LGEALRVVLIPLALLYALVLGLRRRLRRGAKVGVPVVSVGNLELGGTGKSPCVRWLASRLVAQGFKVLVVARGYGARASATLDEEGAELAAHGFRVVQGPRRLQVIAQALAEDQADIILLDDGFQQRDVAVDCHILLLDARRPFGGGWTLPAGSLRECPKLVSRPDVVVLTRADAVLPSESEAAQRRVAEVFPTVPILRGVQKVQWEPQTRARLQAARVHLLAGIARPEEFRALAEREGLFVTGTTFMPDHHAWSLGDWNRASEQARAEGAEVLVTTGKDWPKLGHLAGVHRLECLHVGFHLEAHEAEIIEARCARLARQGAKT
jgi:tetraacyldisaccharide 4'-kinase